MKKTVLSIVLASALLLTACGTSHAKKETEATTTTSETTTEATTTTESETTTTEPAEDVIKPLFKSSLTLDDIKKVAPEDLSNFDKFCNEYFSVTNTSGKYYQIEGLETVTLSASTDKNRKTDVQFFFFKAGADVANTGKFSGTDGTLHSQTPFIPLFYNETKGCLVGYRDAMINAHKFTFVEKYTDMMVEVSPSEYGL